MSISTEEELWKSVKERFCDPPVEWGTIWSWNFRNDPKRLAFVLSRYKFASQMGKNAKTVLEMGCGEGIGASILGEGRAYVGVDYDAPQIQAAKKNFHDGMFQFIAGDFFEQTFGAFDLVVSLDVIEHIYQKYEDAYLQALCSNVKQEGIVIVGTPNETTTPYASTLSRQAHVNMYSQERMRELFSKYFRNVFCFGMNDEVVHTGFAPMSQYLFCLACNKRER